MTGNIGNNRRSFNLEGGDTDKNSKCPICFNLFLSSNIESHAATCNGISDSIEATQAGKEQNTINGKNMQPEKVFPEKQTVVSSFFKPPLGNKRPLASKETNRNENTPKKTKVEEHINSNHLLINSKKDSKCLRRPLADEMRPTGLDDYIGQEDVVGPKGNGFWRPLFQSISKLGADIAAVPSMIFWGPPGCGKTSLANILSAEVSKAQNGQWRFARLSACNAGIAQVKEEVSKAKNERSFFKRSTMLFIDEVHRFNKIQQDALLPHVEDGTITLIGATTENPSFSINSALLSRCRVISLHKLAPSAISDILKRALEKRNIKIINGKEEIQRKNMVDISIEEEAVEYLSNVSDGDARTALNCLEISLEITKENKRGVEKDNITSINMGASEISKTITVTDIKSGLKRSHMLYDKKGDEHYHCASALQKSIRGSDDSAALYWLMRMFEGGEDPLFIARRLVRIASEDVGLGDPKALSLAVSAMQGCQLIGRPECDVILAECATYLARAKKSHEVYNAMNRVKQLIMECGEGGKNLPPVPLHLRNVTSSLERNLGYGAGYSHDLNKVKKIMYMPEELKNERFF